MTFTISRLAFCATAFLVLLQASTSLAQSRPEARQVLEEAQAHEAAGRHAMAAQRYLDLYDVMRAAEMPRAPIALWSAGLALSELTGREEEALRVLRQFQSESTTLTDDAQVRDWRSNAISLIAELEARVPAATQTAPEEVVQPSETAPAEVTERAEHPSAVGPIVLGAGGAALVAGIVIGALSLGMDGEFRDACADVSRCPSDLMPQYDEMRAFSTAADVLMVSGGVIAAVGLVLTFALTERDAPPVSVSASCSFDGCAATVRGSL